MTVRGGIGGQRGEVVFPLLGQGVDGVHAEGAQELLSQLRGQVGGDEDVDEVGVHGVAVTGAGLAQGAPEPGEIGADAGIVALQREQHLPRFLELADVDDGFGVEAVVHRQRQHDQRGTVVVGVLADGASDGLGDVNVGGPRLGEEHRVQGGNVDSLGDAARVGDDVPLIGPVLAEGVFGRGLALPQGGASVDVGDVGFTSVRDEAAGTQQRVGAGEGGGEVAAGGDRVVEGQDAGELVVVGRLGQSDGGGHMVSAGAAVFAGGEADQADIFEGGGHCRVGNGNDSHFERAEDAALDRVAGGQ
ncbi:hypothetical protein MOBUDSM44075_04164 [Mycolicibacterium obuense]|uniref:Uncharacterized protein n=1 Tax=Mycolicibacterium obuense TaxID=1807 RepID=A0A0J6VLM9_9MYCO|nr:hypothetical protein MOBUDSM44075_04164 [Mycolicibacterium obuense]